jgi:hypothetical protein
MLDFALNANGDLDLSQGGLALIDGAGRIAQQVGLKLRLWQGEWFLDTSFGTPYLQSILGKSLTLSGALAALRKSVLEVDGVTAITAMTYDYQASQRSLSLDMSLQTDEGLVEVAA